jgi:hypothetical protein
MKILRESAPLVAACVMVLGWAACSSYTTYATHSLPAEVQINVDGKSEDWLGALAIIENGSASIGFRNDRRRLFVCLMVEDEFLIGQAMRQGLTLWFDPKGGTAKNLGIKYPLGSSQEEMSKRGRGEPGQPPPEDFSGEISSALEIIRSQKEDPQRMEVADVSGIEVIVTVSRGLLIYELKIPLAQTETELIAVGAQPGQTIGVGFEIPKPDRGQMPGPSEGGGGMPPGRDGGMPPMGGQGGARGGMRSGGGMEPRMSRGLRVWALVRLSLGDIDRPAALLSAIEAVD